MWKRQATTGTSPRDGGSQPSPTSGDRLEGRRPRRIAVTRTTSVDAALARRALRPLLRAGGNRARGLSALGPTVLGVVVGCLLVAVSFNLAHDGSEMRYEVFWVGMLSAVLPIAARLLAQDVCGRERQLLILLLGLVTYVPKFLRNPGAPLLFDEIAHWSQAERLARTGSLYEHNIVSAIGSYPGLHFATEIVRVMSDASVWQSGVAVVLAAHVVSLFGIVRISMAAGFGDRLGAAAALLYALNPGFLYFTTLYAYESLAIALQIWTITAAVEAVRSTQLHVARAWQVVGVLLMTSIAVTHHLTSLLLAAFLVLAICLSFGSSSGSVVRRRIAPLLVVSLLLNPAWIAWHDPSIISYLLALPLEGVNQLAAVVKPEDLAEVGGEASGSRGIFRGSGLPLYETLAAVLAVLVVNLLALLGVWQARGRLSEPMFRWLVAVAALYPLSVPLVLTSAGAPAAHRSWPFTWVFLAPLVAAGLLLVVDAARSWLFPPVGRPLAILIVAVVLVGNTASEVHEEARFPGTFVAGSDARMLSSEVLELAAWLRQQPAPRSFISDIYTGNILAGYGRARYAKKFPTWDLLFYPSQPEPRVLDNLRSADVEYLVVDRRVSEVIFRGGYYVDRNEPLAGERAGPIPVAALDKLDELTWADKVYTSEHYDVYRFDLPHAGLGGDVAQ